MLLPDPEFVVCQDCIAILPFTNARDMGLEKCACGGFFAACSASSVPSQPLNIDSDLIPF